MTDTQLIESKIQELEKRILAGEELMRQCKKQLRQLKAQCKEFNRLKNQIKVSGADGDL